MKINLPEQLRYVLEPGGNPAGKITSDTPGQFEDLESAKAIAAEMVRRYNAFGLLRFDLSLIETGLSRAECSTMDDKARELIVVCRRVAQDRLAATERPDELIATAPTSPARE